MIFTCAITLQISPCLFSNLSLVLKSAEISGFPVDTYNFTILKIFFIYGPVDGVTFAFQYSQTSENFKVKRNMGGIENRGRHERRH